MSNKPASALRIGQGQASRRLEEGYRLLLAGCDTELQVSSMLDDGDVVCQAVIEALLSSLALPGIDTIFPVEDLEQLRHNSLVLLSRTVSALQRRHMEQIVNVSISLQVDDETLRVSLEDRWRLICGMLASALQVERDCIGFSIGRIADGLESGCVYSWATILVLRRSQPGAGGSREPATARPESSEAATEVKVPASRAEPEQDILEDPTLPKRAREFESAVRSGLHPLPRAKTPQPGSTLYIYSDGASRGNPGKAATGFVVMDAAGMLVHEGGSRLEDCTNNQAEYRAIIEALEWVEKELGHEFHLECRLDSELVVKQLRGEYKVKKEELKPLSMKALNLLMYFSSFELRHVPRAENARADAMANAVLDNDR